MPVKRLVFQVLEICEAKIFTWKETENLQWWGVKALRMHHNVHFNFVAATDIFTGTISGKSRQSLYQLLKLINFIYLPLHPWSHILMTS